MRNKIIARTIALLLVTTSPICILSQLERLTRLQPISFSVFNTPQNIGGPVNSPENESGAFVAPNGLSLYFSGNGSGTLGAGDLWVAQRPTLTSAWGPPQNLGAVVNSVSIENQPSLSLDGKTMFFNSDRAGGVGRQDLYMTTRTDPSDDFGWIAPINLIDVNSASAEVGSAYFEDPNTGAATLFFASDRGLPEGLDDIFQSSRNPDGTFDPPTPVTELNDPEQDGYPKLRRDGLEVFFHSTRVGGAGGLDIWTSTRASTNSRWNTPVNVSNLNTDGFDGTPSLSPDGSILFFGSTRDGGSGSIDVYTASRVSVNRAPLADFDGDARSDVSVFRPSQGTWWLMRSADNTIDVRQFGLSGDKIVPGDYDGDGRTDLAVFRPSDRNWYIELSSDRSVSIINWGLSNDTPVPADYDGDGRTDIAVYRDGTWFIQQSSTNSVTYQNFGLSTDVPVTAGVQ